MSASHDGADPEVRRLIALLQDGGPDATPADLRDAFLDFVRRVEATGTAHADVAEVHDTVIAGDGGILPVRIYTPRNQQASTRTSDCFVYLHGGGWVVGDLETGDLGARALCAGLGMRLVSVHYRLAPEHPFPAPFDDGMTVIRAVRRQTTGSLYVGGESAGANLSAAIALACRDEAIPLAGQLLINPAVRRDPRSASHRRLGDGEGLTTDAVVKFFDWYAAGADPADARISPIYARSLAGVAPCFLVTAEYDPLLDDGVDYASRLMEAGVPVTYLPMPKMMHAWWALLTASDAAAANLDRMLSLARGFVAAYR